MELSPRLSLSYVAPSQAQKHVTVNETFRRLDALVQASVRSRSLDAEPAAPEEGEGYLLTAAPTGAAWDYMAPHILAFYQDGGWVGLVPPVGLRVWIADEGVLAVHDGAGWREVGAGETAVRLGVNTTPDDANRLAVKSDAILFSHDDVTPGAGDCRVKINKEAAGDTASVIFQTAFSGRAEFGLTGDDDFHVKVSPDGSAWAEALVIDKDTRQATFTASGTPVASVNDDDNSATLLLTNYVESAGGGNFTIQKARGTQSSPAACQAGDIIGGYFTNGYHSGGGFSGNVGFAGFRAHENFTAAAQGTSFEIATVSDGATSRTIRGVWHEGLVVGSATGGDKGAGTINAEAVYDDNALLSCYVFDQALDGAVDLAKWDGRVPDRQVKEYADDGNGDLVFSGIRTEARAHDPLRKFAGRIGTAHDPLTLDGYARHWREKRHLTALPNEAKYDDGKGLAAGEWIQRLVETVEIQAVLIEQLNQRVKTLEAGAP